MVLVWRRNRERVERVGKERGRDTSMEDGLLEVSSMV